MSFRIEKISSILKSAIGNILLNRMADPELRKISVSSIVLSSDLKTARVYISSFDSDPDKTVIKLNNAKGYIRKELSGSVYLKFLPDLQFFYDTAFEFDQKKVE